MTVPKQLRLFDVVDLYDGPALQTESSIRFLTRAKGEFWQQVRTLLEEWYARFPDSTGDLRARFRQDDPHQHVAAWWELYTYILFVQLGYVVDVHPGVEGTSNAPDFRILTGTETMYVECAVLFEDDSETVSDAQAWLFDCINETDSADFMGDITVEQIGTVRPRKRDIVGPIERWLAALDWADVSALVDGSGEAPQETFEIRGWRFTLGAWPVRAEKRGIPGRFIGSSMVGDARARSDEKRLRDLIARKGARYGAAQPLVLAILAWSSCTEEDDLTNALFGSIAAMYYENSSVEPWLARQRDGYWRPNNRQRGSRLGGVLFGTHLLKPWNPVSELPLLWINPWAANRLQPLSPFGIRTIGDTGIRSSTEPIRTATDVFGVDQGR